MVWGLTKNPVGNNHRLYCKWVKLENSLSKIMTWGLQDHTLTVTGKIWGI